MKGRKSANKPTGYSAEETKQCESLEGQQKTKDEELRIVVWVTSEQSI